jgi:hypothetical protein
MFTGSVLTRRLRLRRLRRSAARFGRKLDAVVGLPDLDDMLGELCVWATGMPWVVESPCAARERLKLFVIDCTPLSCVNHGSPSTRSMTTLTMDLGLS